MQSAIMQLLHTPLWPAGHLSLKGGDQPALTSSPIDKAERVVLKPELPISPLEGEMAAPLIKMGPEGGATGGERRTPFKPRTVRSLS